MIGGMQGYCQGGEDFHREQSGHPSLLARIEVLEKKLAEAEKDVGRLNYLSQNHVYRLCGADSWVLGFNCGANPHVREAIDAAWKEQS